MELLRDVRNNVSYMDLKQNSGDRGLTSLFIKNIEATSYQTNIEWSRTGNLEKKEARKS